MRWGASLVAEAFRIFQRGGVFLYPGDSRKTYEKGRLRLVYEANPIAFVTEQAGGAATTGRKRILDIVPQDIHQRTPLVFGSTDHVEQIGRYYNDINPAANRAPLFGTRGLLRV
jgi:fructose-1,6-bisphosphatase I